MGKSSYPYLALERNSIPSDLSPRNQKQPSDLAIRGTPSRSDGLDPKESAEAGAVQEAHGSTQGEDLTRVDEAKGSTVPPPIGRRESRDPLICLSRHAEGEGEREIWAGSRISPTQFRPRRRTNRRHKSTAKESGSESLTMLPPPVSE
jgi:hypothetical protein